MEKTNKSRKVIGMLLTLAMILSVLSVGLVGNFTASAATSVTLTAMPYGSYQYGGWVTDSTPADSAFAGFDSTAKSVGEGIYYYAFFTEACLNYGASDAKLAIVTIDANGDVTVKDGAKISGAIQQVGSSNAKLIPDGDGYFVAYGYKSTLGAPRGSGVSDSTLSTWSNIDTNKALHTSGTARQGFSYNSINQLASGLGVPARTVSYLSPGTVNINGMNHAQYRVDASIYPNYYNGEVKHKSEYTYDDYFLHDYYCQGVWDAMPAAYGWTQDQYTEPGKFTKLLYPNVNGKSYSLSTGGQNPWVMMDYIERQCKASSNNLWNGWKFGYDEIQKAPYVWHQTTGTFLSYESKESLTERANYINQKNLAGVIIWELSGDNTNTYPMISQLRQQLGSKQIIGYFTNWSVYNAFHQTQSPSELPWDLMSMINYSFFQVGGTYERELPAPANSLNSMDRWADDYNEIEPGSSAPNMLEKARTMKQSYPNTKLMVSVGGWTRGDGFYDMVRSDSNQTTFVTSCQTFLNKYPFFDGIDLDWEYPGAERFPDFDDPADRGSKGGGVDFVQYVKLAQKLKTMLDARGSGKNLLTACVPAAPDNIDRQDVVALANNCTYLNIMTYDYHGAFDPIGNIYNTSGNPTGQYYEIGYNSPLIGRTTARNDWATNNTVDYLLGKGVPASKMNIGTPFYSRGWSGIPTINRTSDGKPIPAGIADPTPFEYTAETSIVINTKPTTMQVGATPIQLTATVVPAGSTITWQSSNSSIASVSSTGVLTAVAAGGPVTITATANGKSDSFQITITGIPSTYTDVVFKVLNSKVSKNLVTSEIRSSVTNGLITPVLVGGKTMIPLRCLATVFGATSIVWNSTLGPQGGAEIAINGVTLSMPAGEMYFDKKNNSTGVTERIVITAGNPPVQFCTANDIYIPLRSVTEATGYKVDWQGQFWDAGAGAYLGYACITTNQNAVAGDAYFQKMYNDSKNLFN